METALTHISSTAPVIPAHLSALAEQAQGFARQAKARSTLRAYGSDWNHFHAWCSTHGLSSLPAAPETVALYIADLAGIGRKVATIARRLAGISKGHQVAGLESPASMKYAVVSETWKGIRRAQGTAPAQKAALLTGDIRAMCAVLPAGLLGIRDRALLLVGFAGAFRRSELVGLDRQDCELSQDGLVITLRRSKTDPEGAGRKVGIPYGSSLSTCPPRALQAWLEASGITTGPVFHSVNRHGQMQAGRLSDKAVARTVKHYAAAAGLDPAKYAGHSLRAGLATSAAIAGASERSIMAQTGHRSVTMARRYIRAGSLFRENAAGQVGL